MQPGEINAEFVTGELGLGIFSEENFRRGEFVREDGCNLGDEIALFSSEGERNAESAGSHLGWGIAKAAEVCQATDLSARGFAGRLGRR
ncbi:MAG: hypothetical protein RL514_4550 [Verrucomicrobiota bacterium]